MQIPIQDDPLIEIFLKLLFDFMMTREKFIQLYHLFI